MGLEVGGVEEISHGNSPCEKGVGDEGTVAAPGNRLGAEKNEATLLGLLFQMIQSGGKFRGLHVIGEPSEARIPPGSVWRTRLRMAQTAKRSRVFVAYAAGS